MTAGFSLLWTGICDDDRLERESLLHLHSYPLCILEMGCVMAILLLAIGHRYPALPTHSAMYTHPSIRLDAAILSPSRQMVGSFCSYLY